MAAIEYILWVCMEDAEPVEVKADQRDVAAWEMQPFGTSGNDAMTRINLFMRFVAWNSMRRRKATKLGWDAFNDQCLEVIDRAPGDDSKKAAAGDAVDPGRPAPTDAG